MKKIAVAVLILATLCSFAAAEPRYTYGYNAPQSESSFPEPKYTYGYTPQSEIRIPDLFGFLGVEAEYVDSFKDDEMDTIDIYTYRCSSAINAPLLFYDYIDCAAAAGCDFIGYDGEYVSLSKDDILFMLVVHEDEPETVYLIADSRLTIGGI